MFKVLLVDDERIIREGIARLIDWKQLDLCLIGTAVNGREAADMIERDKPDIVITDVKMPVLDGIDLIAMENARHPEIAFIVLSGYGEFELASAAMRYGVKHYLLKPCNETGIIDALRDVTGDLRRREKRESLLRESQNYLRRMLPLMQDQFLQEYAVNGSYTEADVAYYCRLLHIEQQNCRVILFQAERDIPFDEIYVLRNIVTDRLPAESVRLIAIMINRVLVISHGLDDASLPDRLDGIRSEWVDYGCKSLTISYSDEVEFRLLPQAYREAERCLRFSFYLGEGGIITPKDVTPDPGEKPTTGLIYDYDRISGAIKSGNVKEVQAELDTFFSQLRKMAFETSVAKTYCMELYLTVVRQCGSERIGIGLEKLADIQQMDSIARIREAITEISVRMAADYNEDIRNRQSRLVGAMVQSIQENLNNEQLSLKWLANHVFFMNVGYLGRLFCRETGEKFSRYVLQARMEKAKKLIEQSEDERIYEVAHQVGFGDNAQYFSQLFKKVTGCTPSEYKMLVRTRRIQAK